MKNLLLLATLLCTVGLVQAQLYVAPNGATDTYVYVNDEILFVEQGIQLVKNNTVGEESSVYLRDDAQLIQGTSNTDNSGNGSISVLQNTPDSDSYDYTYWNSPVGRPHTAIAGNRAFDANLLNEYSTLKNSTQAAFTNAYNGIESPLTISRRWIYIHERGWEEISSYQHVANSWNIITAGLGYTMKGVGTTNHDQVYDFRGRPNNGEITVPVFDGEWTLSGNPYPSALDLNEMYYDADNDEIVQLLYWDEDHSINSHNYSQNRGGYGTWVPGGPDPGGSNQGTYSPPVFQEWNEGGGSSGGSGSGAMYDRRFAPIGQGFMIQPDGTDDGVIHIKNSHRRYIKEGSGSDFRSPTDQAEDPAVDMLPQFRFNTYFGESHGRQMVQLFAKGTTDNFDRGYDGISPMDASSEIYFPSNGADFEGEIPLVISTTDFAMDKMLPLTIVVNDEQYNVQLEVIEMINFNQTVYLFDRLAKTYQQISGGEKSNTMLNPGTYEDRFYLTFQSRNDTVADLKELSDVVKKSVAFFQNNPERQLEVTNPEGYDITQAQIFDMNGKLLYNGANLGKSYKLTFPTANFSDGIYLVRLTTATNGTIDYKINVFNK